MTQFEIAISGRPAWPARTTCRSSTDDCHICRFFLQIRSLGRSLDQYLGAAAQVKLLSRRSQKLAPVPRPAYLDTKKNASRHLAKGLSKPEAELEVALKALGITPCILHCIPDHGQRAKSDEA